MKIYRLIAVVATHMMVSFLSFQSAEAAVIREDSRCCSGEATCYSAGINQSRCVCNDETANCWENPIGAPLECVLSGACATPGTLQNSKCKDLDGLMTAYTLQCTDTTQTTFCTIPTATCSDGIQNQGETGIDCGGPCAACTSAPICGNSVKEGTEACDLGIANNGPCPKTCSTLCTTNTCVTQTCGNGVKEGTEACDNGASNGACPAACSSSCTTNTCASVGPCGAATCYKCSFKGLCVQDNTYGTYDDPACFGDCDLGGGINP